MYANSVIKQIGWYIYDLIIIAFNVYVFENKCNYSY